MLKKEALGQPCLLCGDAAGGYAVCAACSAAAPRVGLACARCALPLREAGPCGRCLRDPPAFDDAIAALLYRFPVDRLVLRFKHGGDFAAGRWLSGALAHATREVAKPDLLVVPPLDRARLRERGFNQALEIARHVGRVHGIAVASQAVVRTRPALAQASLDRSERLSNLRGAFRAASSLGGRHVAIVDDVMTTGATAEAMADAIRRAGAARVCAWVAARTPEPGR